MFKKIKFPIAGISPKILWFLVCAMLITHIVVFLYYYQKNSRVELKVNRDIITQQTMHVIETIIAAEPDKRQKVVDSLEVPGLKVSIDKTPQYKPHIVSNSLWPILVALRKQYQDLQVSVLLQGDNWLNVYATIVPTTWTLQIFLLILEVIVVIVVLLFIWSINRFAMPLKEFMLAADRMGVDLNSPPIVVRGPAVVRDTADAMNQMQKRIQELIRDRTQMLAAISHDLRTPITRLKLRAQFIDDQAEKNKIIADLNEMEAMVKETLAFAREDSRGEMMVKMDISSLLDSLCSDFADMGHDVNCVGNEERISILGRPIALKRAFNNIIDNAIKYAGAAEVTLQAKKGDVAIIIEDQGPGIPQNELARVFSPFYRGEKSRSRDTGGTGLGLTVTQDIILAHKGTIELTRRKGGGLRVIVELPRT